MKKINVIDLDKTLIPYDSFRKIILKQVFKFDLKVIYILILRIFRFINASDFKARLAKNMKKRVEKINMKQHAEEIYKKIDPRVHQIIKNETDESTENVLISASPNFYVKFLIEKLDWNGSGSYFTDSGNFVHLQGKHKIKWLVTHYKPSQFVYNMAISDGDSDNELLKMFDKSIKW